MTLALVCAGDGSHVRTFVQLRMAVQVANGWKGSGGPGPFTGRRERVRVQKPLIAAPFGVPMKPSVRAKRTDQTVGHQSRVLGTNDAPRQGPSGLSNSQHPETSDEPVLSSRRRRVHGCCRGRSTRRQLWRASTRIHPTSITCG